MNKTSIKNFAIWARNKLIEEITYKAGLYGITDAGIAPELPASTDTIKFYNIGTKEPAKVEGKEIQMRNSLAKVIERKAKDLKYKEAFEYVVEEVAYTWFNRLIAVRFMEVNDYLPSGVRVLSSEISGKNEPDMVSSPFETDIDFTDADREYMANLKDDELFRFLFIKQCNKLNEVLPELFEKTDNYTELLLTLSFTDTDSVVYHLVHDISEDDFNVEKEGQVQIIGWLYQYYNTEPKDKVFAALKKNVKISKENIPAATQLFTPDWIVRYMVENSLGRLWVDGHSDFDKSEWKYYLEEVEQEDDVKAQLEQIRAEAKNLTSEDIKVLDPCMGSGHILVYAFDVLMQIYLSQGYSERDAASLIIKNNIFGADIDKRAYQLSYFALMMKGRAHDRRFLTRGVKPNICNFQELGGLDVDNLSGDLADFVKQFENADTYGSLLEVGEFDVEKIAVEIESFEEDMFTVGYKDVLERMLEAYKIIGQKYDAVVTNPPYMGSGGMDIKLTEYVKNNYPDSKYDMFSVFIEKCSKLTSITGLYSMITQPSLLFISSFEKIRIKIITLNTIDSLIHMGRGIFGVDFGSTAFVMRNKRIKGYLGSYFKLHERTFQYIDPDDISKLYISAKNNHSAVFDFSNYDTQNTEIEDTDYSHKSIKLFHKSKQEDFLKIPGVPMAYWLGQSFIRAFDNQSVKDYLNCKSGIMTGDEKFIKLWYELSLTNIKFDCRTYEDMKDYKWFPLNSGGEYRKWYGNNVKVVNLWRDGLEIRQNVKNYRLREKELYFQKGITWGRISSSKIGFRNVVEGSLFGDAGPIGFINQNKNYMLGFLCSNTSLYFLEATNPTLNYQVRDIENIPFILSFNHINTIEDKVKNNIIISKTDWDSFETSWDFIKHPLISVQDELTFGQFAEARREKIASRISECFSEWKVQCNKRFIQLKENEEELNRIFIEIYGLQDELTPEVEDKDVTVRKADLTRDIKSFISYAVGCMFGRYSLDVEGLAYAGGDWDDSKYSSFIPVKDNCIIITDEEFFSDDIVNRFVEFVKAVYGEETLEENLDFIADALGNKGTTSRQKIRNYFLSDFIKDHNKIYQKRPIYWMFDSGKQNGFKALVYMHRWNADTIGNVRVEYLHKLQRVYESEINRMQETIDNSANSKEIANAEKRKDKLSKQQKEAREYDEKISHLALMRTDIDLDDGVKVNYEKVQTAQDGRKLEVLVKI